MGLTNLVPDAALPWVMAALLVLSVLVLGVGVFVSIRSKNYKLAALRTGVLLDETVRAVDKIKNVTDGTNRDAVKSVLRSLGDRLDNLGLKVALDDRVTSLGLDDKS